MANIYHSDTPSENIRTQFEISENLSRNNKISSQNQYLLLKKGVWLYFFLLIFEGALRKWFLPSLATPLLIIRDPVALWLIFVASRRGLLPSNPLIIGMVLIGVIGINTAFLFGHGNLLVALYGARPLLLNFPLIFVIGRIFDKEDVVKIGKVMLWISIPMTFLIALQFYSPQSAWVNRGVGGDLTGAGFSGAGDYFRPPGTFSFTNGTTFFYSFLTPFILYFWLNSKNVNRLLLISATGALFIAIPLSISRGLFFQIAVSIVFTIAATLKKQQYFGKLMLAIFFGLIAMALLNKTSFFTTAFEAFTSRFDTATEQEGGLKGTLGDRFLGGMINELTNSSEQPFFGYGLGMGTNVGSMLLEGKRQFLISEGEWGRLIGELGPLLGIAVIFFRIQLAVRLTLASYKKLLRNNLLPWLLLSFGLLTILQSQWAQPTALGFSTLIGGLIIASLRIVKD